MPTELPTANQVLDAIMRATFVVMEKSGCFKVAALAPVGDSGYQRALAAQQATRVSKETDR